jgi:hypothetical protein
MHHKLIYGAPAKEIRKKCGGVNVKSPFAVYKGPPRDAKEIGSYIGFECGRVNGLFTDFTYTYDKTFTIIDYAIPQQIKELFEQTYPGVDAMIYALIQDVYCAKFARGFVATGYWVFCDEETKDNIMEAYNEGSFNNFDIVPIKVGHNMVKNTPSDLFIGNIIGDIENCEDCEPWCFNELAEKLSGTYTANDIPDRKNILEILQKVGGDVNISLIPMTCVIEGMCYCCT